MKSIKSISPPVIIIFLSRGSLNLAEAQVCRNVRFSTIKLKTEAKPKPAC